MRIRHLLPVLAAGLCGVALGYATGGSAQQFPVPGQPAQPGLPIQQPSPQLDPNAPPVLGLRQIAPATLHHLELFRVASGGPVAADTASPGSCRGHITSYPTIVFEATAAFPHFQVTVESDGDTTLLVRAPDGSITCNDDTFGTDPSITIGAAQPGRYLVWVGSYSQGQMHQGTLRVTDQPYVPVGHQQQVQPPPPPNAGTFDPNLPPQHGSINVTRRLPRDPARVQLMSGGPEHADPGSMGGGCLGWAPRAPHYQFNLQQARSYMQLWVRSAGADTTLLVRHPDGTFTCNDDCENLEPMVELIDPQAGVYNVWVGSYHQQSQHAATLHVSGRRSNKRRPQC